MESTGHYIPISPIGLEKTKNPVALVCNEAVNKRLQVLFEKTKKGGMVTEKDLERIHFLDQSEIVVWRKSFQTCPLCKSTINKVVECSFLISSKGTCTLKDLSQPRDFFAEFEKFFLGTPGPGNMRRRMLY